MNRENDHGLWTAEDTAPTLARARRPQARGRCAGRAHETCCGDRTRPRARVPTGILASGEAEQPAPFMTKHLRTPMPRDTCLDIENDEDLAELITKILTQEGFEARRPHTCGLAQTSPRTEPCADYAGATTSRHGCPGYRARFEEPPSGATAHAYAFRRNAGKRSASIRIARIFPK